MFIAYTNTETKYVEGKENFTWDDIPATTVLTSLSLTFPFTVSMSGKDVSPKVNLGKYDAYYFYNEAVASVISNEPGAMMDPVLQAKVIAGIDYKNNIVVETRLDKWGNVSINTYSYQILKDLIAQNKFAESSLRYGNK